MNSHKTAMSIQSPSNATRKLVSTINSRDLNMPVILDYGAGNGRNSVFMNKEISNAIIFAYDPFPHKTPLFPIIEDLDSVEHMVYDYVLCSFVFNTLEYARREQVIEKISLLNTRNLIIELRSVADVNRIKHKRRVGDGYVTSRGTFQKGYKP